MKKILSIFILTSALLLSGCASENVETEEPKVAEETVSSQEEAEAQEVVAPKSEIEEYDEQEALEYKAKVQAVYDNLDAHIGETVTLKGIVRITEDYKDNEFMVTRFLVDCCIDDSSPLGFFTRLETGDMPKVDEWVEVTGKIVAEDVTDKATGTTIKRPVLIAEKVEIVKPLPSQYIYNN